MKRPLYLLLVVLMLFSGLGWVACGGGGEKTAETTPESTSDELTMKGKDVEAEDEGDDEGDVVGSGGKWEDMPIYANAKYDDTGVMSMPGLAVRGEGKSEVRHYVTKDDPSDVIKFFKKQMGKKGWTMLMEHEEEKEGWGSAWQKKNGAVIANVTVIANEDGDCDILLGRHTDNK